jgi:hypothetical protein
MLSKRVLLSLALTAGLLATSCTTLISAYLISQLLDNSAPKRTWSGTVRDTTGNPVGGVLVSVRGEVEGDTNIMKFEDTTETDGAYSISFRWNENVQYKVRVEHDGVILAEQDYGTIELGDRLTDFTIQGAVNVELSGVVRDVDGHPLSGVVVVGASASALDATPITLLDQEGDPQHELTNDSGVFQLNGSIARYGIVCAFHPDHGFAYAVGEDNDDNGSIALDIVMGGGGEHNVNIRVVDGNNAPISNQVLDASRQFRLRLDTPFNLAAPVDVVVGANGYFNGMVGEPSDRHPSAVTLLVQSTGADGMADAQHLMDGGTYNITLLKVFNDDPATALVQSDNPLAIAEDSTIVIRVN